MLDIGHGIPGPFAARILGDFGADVIKLERAPEGDFVRRLAPFIDDETTGQSVSALFEYLNWNKRSVELDLADRLRHRELRALVESSDLIILSFAPGRLEEWGLSHKLLRDWNDSAVLVSITNFGHEGPHANWAGSDLVFNAAGGVMQISGTVDREPLKPGLAQSLYAAGFNAAYAGLAGVYAARETSHGALIDLAVAECVASEMVMNEPLYAFAGAIQGRRPRGEDPLAAGRPMPTLDGFISLQTNPLTAYSKFIELFDDPRLADPRFETENGRMRHAEEFSTILAQNLAKQESREFFERAGLEGLLAGMVQSASQQLNCPQLAAREMWHTFDRLSAAGKPVRFPARLAAMSATPVTIRGRAPALGADSSDVFRTLTPRRRRRRGDVKPLADGDGPLSGLRVLDLSTVFAVPYMGALLCDLGAEVIKVEAPHRLDQARSSWGIAFENDPSGDYWNRATTFPVLNRGKKSIAVDLSVEEGRTLLRTLVSKSDILLDNFTPRVMRKWGTTYENLRETNPGLIMLSNTGYGSTGPWSAFKAQGTTLEATMGLTTYTGYAGGAPSKAGQSHPDFLACWAGLTSLLAALVHRQSTGEGQWVDLGMYQLGPIVIPEALLHYQSTGQDLPRVGNVDVRAVVSGVVPTQGKDRWLAISIADEDGIDELWRLLPELERVESTQDLLGHFARWASRYSASEAASLLQSRGIAAAPITNARDLLEDVQLQHRGFYELADFGPPTGTRWLIGRPYRWCGAHTAVIRGPSPKFAEDNDAVIGAVGGLHASAIRGLRADAVISDTPLNPPAAEAWDMHLMQLTGALADVDPEYRQRLAERRPPSHAFQASQHYRSPTAD